MIPRHKIVRTIQSTDRFEKYEAEFEGKKVFAKKALIDKTRELLAGIPQNSKVINHLGGRTDFKFRAPKIYKKEKDWIVTEWINGGSLDKDIFEDPQMVADILAEFMTVFDIEPAKKEGF